MRLTEQTQVTEMEHLVLDVLGQCAMLVLRIQKIGNSAHPDTSDIEVYLMAAARAAADIDHFFAAAWDARAIDAHLFAAPTCIGSTVH